MGDVEEDDLPKGSFKSNGSEKSVLVRNCSGSGGALTQMVDAGTSRRAFASAASAGSGGGGGSSSSSARGGIGRTKSSRVASGACLDDGDDGLV